MVARYFALASDYDGTLGEDGNVEEATLNALRQVAASGRKLILLTGRELDDLLTVFPEIGIFDLVVAENGALIYRPQTREEIIAASLIDPALVAALKRRKVRPLSQGKVIVSTREPNETVMLETIRDLGLELQVIFNKGAVMVLPSGINKASGLRQALTMLDLSPHNTVGIGDAENDHAFLSICEFSVAVANALPMLIERADRVTKRPCGAGVVELIDQLLKDDLSHLSARLPRHQIAIGETKRGREITIPAYGENVLLVGSSGGGKSTLAKRLLERLVDLGYQFCAIDPEGDYEDFEEAVVLGDRSRVPSSKEVLQLLKDPKQNAVVNLLGLGLEQRPAYFSALLMELEQLRSRTARPHWLIVDEAHHVLPGKRDDTALTLPQQLTNVVFLTVEPEAISKQALDLVASCFAVGEHPAQSIAAFARSIGKPVPAIPRTNVQTGDALHWRPGKAATLFKVGPTRFQHTRHRRKYAQGDVGPELSFYFRGPEQKLNLRAQNLTTFAQISEGIDDETWLFHLRTGDYARWFRDVVKDEDLANEAVAVQDRAGLSAEESRRLVLEAIAKRYTLPAATGASPER